MPQANRRSFDCLTGGEIDTELREHVLDEAGTIPARRLVAAVHVWVSAELHRIFCHGLSGFGCWGSDDGSFRASICFFLLGGLRLGLSCRLFLCLFAGLLFLLGFRFGVFLGRISSAGQLGFDTTPIAVRLYVGADAFAGQVSARGRGSGERTNGVDGVV